MEKKSKPWSKRPGKSYLWPMSVWPMSVRTIELAPKCSCEGARGGWRVQDVDGAFYCFDPPTQLQKDIWLGAAKSEAEKEKRIKALRWACFKCGTVQMP